MRLPSPPVHTTLSRKIDLLGGLPRPDRTTGMEPERDYLTNLDLYKLNTNHLLRIPAEYTQLWHPEGPTSHHTQYHTHCPHKPVQFHWSGSWRVYSHHRGEFSHHYSLQRLYFWLTGMDSMNAMYVSFAANV